MKKYETFDHRADMGIRGYGKNLEEAFENGARAMFSVIVEIEDLRPVEREEIYCDASDREMLFVEWLNALLAVSNLNRILFCSFEVHISGNKLRGLAWGEKMDPGRHRIMTEVKAATYSMLKVAEEDDMKVVQCIVDV